MPAIAQKITPFLWFNSNAEEAVNFYVSLFKNSKINQTLRYGDAGPGPKGSVMLISFELDGQKFTALNGGPHYSFSPATSFVIDCEDQAEVDHFWDALVAGGKPNQCAWLDDRFGITWQIVPRALPKLLSDPDPAKAGRVMQAMFKMSKIIVADLQRAYDEK